MTVVRRRRLPGGSSLGVVPIPETIPAARSAVNEPADPPSSSRATRSWMFRYVIWRLSVHCARLGGCFAATTQNGGSS
jgi:hypothetical protein